LGWLKLLCLFRRPGQRTFGKLFLNLKRKTSHLNRTWRKHYNGFAVHLRSLCWKLFFVTFFSFLLILQINQKSLSLIMNTPYTSVFDSDDKLAITRPCSTKCFWRDAILIL
jgi:hypothetical protein